MRRDNNPDRTINPRKLLHRGYVFNVAHAGATILGGEDDAQQTEAAKLFHHFKWELGRFVPFHDMRCDLALRKFAHAATQLLLLIIELEIQTCPPVPRLRSAGA